MKTKLLISCIALALATFSVAAKQVGVVMGCSKGVGLATKDNSQPVSELDNIEDGDIHILSNNASVRFTLRGSAQEFIAKGTGKILYGDMRVKVLSGHIDITKQPLKMAKRIFKSKGNRIAGEENRGGSADFRLVFPQAGLRTAPTKFEWVCKLPKVDGALLQFQLAKIEDGSPVVIDERKFTIDDPSFAVPDSLKMPPGDYEWMLAEIEPGGTPIQLFAKFTILDEPTLNDLTTSEKEILASPTPSDLLDLGLAYRFCGLKEDAQRIYDLAIAKYPGHNEFTQAIAQMRKKR
ncbi:hypothetical protein BH11ARM1_BH11ARM1_11510 [soil metagenome]